jgi:hypothetical protein
VRRAASNPASQGPLALALLVCVAAAACSAATPAATPDADANANATVTPIWTAPPSGYVAAPTPAPSPTASLVVDAASGIKLAGTYRLVYRPTDSSLMDTFTSALASSGLKPRTASREVWDDTGQVGGLVVLDLVGLDLADDGLTTFASAFAKQANADLTWATVGDQRVGVVSQGDQRLELFLVGGDVVIVAGVEADVTDDITRSLIQQNP